MLGDFGEEMEQTSSRVDAVLKKLEKVSHMTSSEWWTPCTFACCLSPLTQPEADWDPCSPSLHLSPLMPPFSSLIGHVTKTVSLLVRSQTVVRHRGAGGRPDCGPHPLPRPLMSAPPSPPGWMHGVMDRCRKRRALASSAGGSRSW